MDSINFKNISVVIQGPIYEGITCKTINNIKEKFPEAEIIVSTWENSNLKELDTDDIIVITNKDPGGYPIYDNPQILNASNRQIVSTLSGLKRASKKYALKIRTDMYFENTNFLEYWGKFPKRLNEYKILKERVLLSTSFAPNPRREPKPYHPSDWFFFGLREDLLDIFNSPLCSEPSTSRYFETHTRPIPLHDSWVPALVQYTAEQYIWIAFLKRFISMDFEHCFDVEKGNVEKSEQIFANNTVLIDAINIKYNSYKHALLHSEFDLAYMYTHYEWLTLYKKYCDSKYQLPVFDIEKLRRVYLAICKKRKIVDNLKSLFNITDKELFKIN